MATPDVFQYLDYRRYLDAWLNHEPAHGRREVGEFARRAGCSVSQVSNVRYRKRGLKSNQIAGFAFAMGFTTEESIYFTALVRGQEASTDEARATAMANIERLRDNHCRIGPRPGPDRPLSCPMPALAPGAENLYLWQVPALAALSACPNAPADLAARVERIRPPVQPAPAAAEPGSTPHRVQLRHRDPAAQTLLQQGLGAARWALYQVPRAQRSHWCSYWCLRERDIVALREAALVQDDRMAALFGEVVTTSDDPASVAYQWANQIVPLSRPVPTARPGESPYRLFTPRAALEMPPPLPPPVHALPGVFDFQDYRSFLLRWFEAKRALNPNYTTTMFARRARCTSKHVEAVTLQNRNLNPPLVQNFARALGLNDEDAAFFAARVAADQATAAADRAQLMRRLAGFAQFHNAQPLVGAALQCASSILHLATFALAFAGDFQPSPEWLAEALGVPEDEAAIALQDLAACRLLQREEGGRWRPSESTLSEAMAYAEPVMILMEEQGLEAAQVALSGDARSRHASALFGAVPARAVPRLREEALGIHRELDALAGALHARALASNSPPERVFIIQTQLFPISEQVDLPPVSTKERRASLRLPQRGNS